VAEMVGRDVDKARVSGQEQVGEAAVRDRGQVNYPICQ